MRRFIPLSLLLLAACAGTPDPVIEESPIPMNPVSSSMPAVVAPAASVPASASSSASSEEAFVPMEAPMDRYAERVTKKPFGIKITRATSPVQPERFSGYHTGTDFEILPGEENETVAVRAICDGPVKMARDVDGYGGVVIQSCEIGDETVTVLYGHITLSLSSIQLKPGTRLQTGRTFATLGAGFTPETDGERKHLHLGIHKGAAAALAGYVQDKDDLAAWIDPMTVLP